jgi:hypothetical protein
VVAERRAVSAEVAVQCTVRHQELTGPGSFPEQCGCRCRPLWSRDVPFGEPGGSSFGRCRRLGWRLGPAGSIRQGYWAGEVRSAPDDLSRAAAGCRVREGVGRRFTRQLPRFGLCLRLRIGGAVCDGNPHGPGRGRSLRVAGLGGFEINRRVGPRGEAVTDWPPAPATARG